MIDNEVHELVLIFGKFLIGFLCMVAMGDMNSLNNLHVKINTKKT